MTDDAVWRGTEYAYDAIAPVYDQFTTGHDYELWVERLMQPLKRHGLPEVGRLLDAGCGTGKSFLPMVERGWSVRAFDLSPGMVEIARTKVDGAVEISVADMRDEPVFGEFDLVWALADSVNHLLSLEELEAALRGMRANLAADGLALFDTNTLRVYRTFFAQDIRVENGGSRMFWSGSTRAEEMLSGTVAEANFEASPSEGSSGPTVPPAVHRERHFSEVEVREALRRCRLKCLDVFGHAEDAVLEQPLEETVHSKAVYLAKAV